MVLEPELSCLESWGATEGASFVVYSVIIGSELERSCLYFIIALDPELLCLGFQDTELCFQHRFGKPDIGFL